MPSAIKKPCLGDGGLCGALVDPPARRCPTHTRQQEQSRGSASSRGYGWTWAKFRERFRHMLIAAGVAPVCGASLPGGPSVPSRCMAEGRFEEHRLHLHHDPPLREDERQDVNKVCDPKRVGFLCVTCHSAETARQMARGAA